MELQSIWCNIDKDTSQGGCTPINKQRTKPLGREKQSKAWLSTGTFQIWHHWGWHRIPKILIRSIMRYSLTKEWWSKPMEWNTSCGIGDLDIANESTRGLRVPSFQPIPRYFSCYCTQIRVDHDRAFLESDLWHHQQEVALIDRNTRNEWPSSRNQNTPTFVCKPPTVLKVFTSLFVCYIDQTFIRNNTPSFTTTTRGEHK